MPGVPARCAAWAPIGDLAGVLAATSGDGSDFLLFVAVVAGLALVGGLGFGTVAWRHRWSIADTPTSKAAGVFLGRCEVAGVARPTVALIHPLTGQPCVWYAYKLERRTRTSNGTSWDVHEEAVSAVPFWVVDDSGAVLVDPRDADVNPAVASQAQVGDPAVTVAQVRAAAGVGVPGAPAPAEFEPAILASGPVSGWDGSWRLDHRWIPDGAQVFVHGTTRMRSDGVVGVEFAAGGTPLPGDRKARKTELLIVEGDEKEAESLFGCAAGCGLVAALVGAFLAPFAAGAAFGQEERFGPVGVALAGLVALWLVGLWLARVHNRLVNLREQAALAWALIATATQRRNDTVASLVPVVQATAAHERGTLVALAATRAQGIADTLPTDAQLTEAGRAQAAGQQAVVRLQALAEATPALGADVTFQNLFGALVHTEDLVSYARRYYNDAIELLRTRRQTFPYLLMARFVTAPSWGYLEFPDVGPSPR